MKPKTPKPSKYERSVIETKALRDYVPKDLRALFDHLISLAAHSHKVGYPKRAGQELAHARKLAAKPESVNLSPLSIPPPAGGEERNDQNKARSASRLTKALDRVAHGRATVGDRDDLVRVYHNALELSRQAPRYGQGAAALSVALNQTHDWASRNQTTGGGLGFPQANRITQITARQTVRGELEPLSDPRLER